MNLRQFTIVLLFMFGQLLALLSNSNAQDGPSVSPWERPQGTKALLESLGIKLSEIKDREPEDEKRLELYLRVLTRLQQLPIDVVQAWSKSPPPLESFLNSPAKLRGDLFSVEGEISYVKVVEIPKGIADRFDVKTIYCLSVDVSKVQMDGKRAFDKPEWMEVWAAQLPAGLKIHDNPGLPGANKSEDEVVSAHVKLDAVFLAITKERDRKRLGDGLEQPIFVANRIAWFPREMQEGNRLTPSNLALSKAGFDISLLDPVRAETSKRLTPEVTEPFLQILAAQGRVDWNSLEAKPLDLAQLVSHPANFVGEAIEFDAIARRIVEIPLDKEADRKRLGIDRYYEIDLVLPKSVRTLVKDKAGREHEIVQENFPVTICATTAPLGIAHGEEIRELVHAKAFFFKLWAYESKFAKAQAGDALQVSPLFITGSIEIAKPAAMSTASALWVVAGALGILACVALWGYLVLRGDDQRERRLTRNRDANSPPPPPLDATP